MARRLDVRRTWPAAVMVLVVAVSGCIESMGSPSDLEVTLRLDEVQYRHFQDVFGDVELLNDKDLPIEAEMLSCPSFRLYPPGTSRVWLLSCLFETDREGRPISLLQPGDTVSWRFALAHYDVDNLSPGMYGISAAMVRDGKYSAVVGLEITG